MQLRCNQCLTRDRKSSPIQPVVRAGSSELSSNVTMYRYHRLSVSSDLEGSVSIPLVESGINPQGC